MKRNVFADPRYDGRGNPILDIYKRRTEEDILKQKVYTVANVKLMAQPAAFNLYQNEIITAILQDRPSNSFRFILTSMPFQMSYDNKPVMGWTGYWE